MLMVMCEEFITTLIFTFYDFKHIFRTFPAAVLQPHFNNFCDTAFEKFCMVFNETILKMMLCKCSIIRDDFIIIIISKTKICFIEYLVFFYVTK